MFCNDSPQFSYGVPLRLCSPLHALPMERSMPVNGCVLKCHNFDLAEVAGRHKRFIAVTSPAAFYLSESTHCNAHEASRFLFKWAPTPVNKTRVLLTYYNQDLWCSLTLYHVLSFAQSRGILIAVECHCRVIVLCTFNVLCSHFHLLPLWRL